MEILSSSSDSLLLNMKDIFVEGNDYKANVINEHGEEIGIASLIAKTYHRLIILDNDFITPMSSKFIERIKSINKKTKAIFIPSYKIFGIGLRIISNRITSYIIKLLIDIKLFKDTKSTSKVINSSINNFLNKLY